MSNTDKVIATTFGNLVSLNEHCGALTQFFTLSDNYFWSNVANWLRVASGIKKVEYHAVDYDKHTLEVVRNYEKDKQLLHDELIKELILFNFIYSGLECLLNNLHLPKCPKQRGKINAACYFLKKHYDNQFLPLKYHMTMTGILRHLLKTYFRDEYASCFEKTEYTSISNYSLKAIYKLRNHFSHGSFIFPEPASWNPEKPLDTEITRVSSRLLLLTMQMLMLAYCKQKKLPSAFKFSDGNILYLHSLHLKKKPKVVTSPPPRSFTEALKSKEN